MDIRTEQLESLLKQQEFQAKKSSATKSEGAGDFAATLQQEVTLGGAEDGVQTAPAPLGAQASLASQVLLANVEDIAALEGGMSTEKAYGYASDAMDKFESYANTLREPSQGNLRDAYNTLEDVASHVQTLKTQSGSLLEQNSNLASIINELEVLATTEKFKFNRGDYST